MSTVTRIGPASAGGRRERNKADKRGRLLVVAQQLFAERGYDAVTTQEIADRADVGTGTLFRYFPSKADLLVEVMSAGLSAGRERALRRARTGADPVEAIMALVAPLLTAGAGHPENTAVYQREILFGDGGRADERRREVVALEHTVEEILRTAYPSASDEDLARAAHTIYASAYVDIVRAGSAGISRRRLTAQLRDEVRYLLDHLLTSAH